MDVPAGKIMDCAGVGGVMMTRGRIRGLGGGAPMQQKLSGQVRTRSLRVPNIRRTRAWMIDVLKW